MFAILNEINNNSHARTTGLITASIGIAAFIYCLVGITGYLSFGNAVGGNIIAMCTSNLYFPLPSHLPPPLHSLPAVPLSCLNTPLLFPHR